MLGRRMATLVRVSDGAALLAVPGGQILNATTLEVGDGGLVGAMACSDTAQVQNDVLGCSTECVGVSVIAERVRVVTGGRIQGCLVSMSAASLQLEARAALLGVRTVPESILRATVGDLSIGGLIRFSTVEVNASETVRVWSTGVISSSGLGHVEDTGPGAGASSEVGGGGGGHVGRGSDACSKSVTGAVLGAGGSAYGQWKGQSDDVGWELGSGGGHGRSTWSLRALDHYKSIPAYPKGGFQACQFDRTCADDDNTEVWNMPYSRERKLLYHPVYEVVRMLRGMSAGGQELHREGQGSALVRSNDSLCFPRGHAVDAWEGEMVLGSSAVPPHPGACAPGWLVSPSMPDFCCRPPSTISAQGATLQKWSLDDLETECDCSPYVTGSNPGGRGGGRIKLSVRKEIVIAGMINADGEGTRAYGESGDPGGGGAGGSVVLAAPLVKGGGVVSARRGEAEGEEELQCAMDYWPTL
jgi:hypothetical protein